MSSAVRIAVVGDLDDERPSHRATDKALLHGAEALRMTISADWLATQSLETEAGLAALEEYDGIFCAPGGPYKSTNGALDAIRFARERGRPFLGT